MFNCLSEIKGFSAANLRKVQTRVLTADGRQLIESRDGLGRIVSKETGKILPGHVQDTKPDLQVAQILPGLTLGSQDPAQDVSVLQKNSITHILNLAPGIQNPVADKYVCKNVELLDLPETDIISVFEECFAFINEARKNKGIVLVHCNAGVSRSATVVIAYLMKHEGKTYNEAYNAVKAKRDVKPNEGFVRQLQQYEKQLAAAASKPKFISATTVNLAPPSKRQEEEEEEEEETEEETEEEED